MKQSPRRSDLLRKTYGFDEIALSPGSRTVDPTLCQVTAALGQEVLPTPLMASAMDSVVSPRSAVQLGGQGVLGVLNLHGLWTRYSDAASLLQEIAQASAAEFVPLMQKLYSAPVQPELVGQRVSEMKAGGHPVAVSSLPLDARRFEPLIAEAGGDYLFVQSTVTSVEHIGPGESLDLAELCAKSRLKVVVGNCVTYPVALALMEAGAQGILVGIGPGAACTSRGVLGLGVPMATAIMDCAEARADFYQRTGRRVAVVADGGIINSGDICKSLACGADFVMLGSLFARAEEAPGLGYHWGMATPSPTLPRGTRIQVPKIGSYQTIVHGPATLDNGLHNLIGALKTSMGSLGAENLHQMQQEVEVIIAQSILSEGKVYQSAQKLGMGSR